MLSNFVFDLVAGTSSTTKQLRRRVLCVANYQFNVLISGPAGCGKRLLAEALHRHSHRSNGTFIPVDCRSLSGVLYKSQMFGDAPSNSLFANTIGCFRSADGGTLFLQNVDLLTLDEQLSLVNAIRDRAVIANGESHRVDVRIVASSSRDLDEEVRAGRFRSDLYYLLAAATVDVTALADRTEDIRPLVSFFISKSSLEYGIDPPQITAAAIALLESYDWPQNVRELEQVIDEAVRELAEDENVLTLPCFEAIAEQLRVEPEADELVSDSKPTNEYETVSSKPLVPESDRWLTLAETESLHIRKTLEQADYNARVAAKMLGLTFRAFQQKLTQHRLHGFLRAKATRRDTV